jgi:hypothetical protein
MTSNSDTLNTYDRNIDKFIERTPKDTIGETKVWLDALIEKVTPESAIFEVGSGFGRDAMYMLPDSSERSQIMVWMPGNSMY